MPSPYGMEEINNALVSADSFLVRREAAFWPRRAARFLALLVFGDAPYLPRKLRIIAESVRRQSLLVGQPAGKVTT